MDYFLTTGQQASELKISSQTIRNLCMSGQIKAERSAGGHYRIAPTELERLKALESLPAVPRATMAAASANGRQATRNELIAAPTEAAIEAAEDSFIQERKLTGDSHKLARLKIRREGTELTDWFACR